MYSMVLMMALSNGAAVPAGSPVVGPMTLHATSHEAYRCHSCCHSCHGGHRCHGYYGCCSYGYGCCSYSYCCSSYGCYGGMTCCASGAPLMAPPTGKAPEPIKDKPKEMDKDKDKEISAPATIQVSLPADAKLTIDGAATTSTASQRTFQSPTLEPGKDYYYTLKAEVVREGKTLTAEARISVRPGAATRVEMSDFRDAGVAAR